MESNQEDWLRIVFRLRGLPSTVETRDDVAELLSEALGDVPAANIRVFSLATTLNVWESPRSKVATVMFDVAPSIVRRDSTERQWLVPTRSSDEPDLLLDIDFLGMTPLNEVDHARHTFEWVFSPEIRMSTALTPLPAALQYPAWEAIHSGRGSREEAINPSCGFVMRCLGIYGT